MSNRIDAMQLSSVPIFRSDLVDFSQHKNTLIEHIRHLKQKDVGRSVSNMGGWQSSANLHQDCNPDVQWLLTQFNGFATACVANYMKGKSAGKLEVLNAWANVNPRNCWNAPHMHLPADWSGVAYIDIADDHFVNEKDGNIVFIDPAPYGARVGRESTFFLKPATGLLVLFPSYLMHMVAPHSADSDRISIAINYKMA